MPKPLQIRERFQITIPASIREKLGWEVGDFVEVDVKENQLILSSKESIDPKQAWFWTKRWQKMEREADEDIKSGRIIKADTVEELIKELKK